MILLAFLVDASFVVGGSCPTKMFLVPDPVGRTSRLAWNPGGMQSVFNEAKRSVMVARCASPVAYLVLRMLLAYKSTVPLLAPLIMIFWFTSLRVSGVGRPM